MRGGGGGGGRFPAAGHWPALVITIVSIHVYNVHIYIYPLPPLMGDSMSLRVHPASFPSSGHTHRGGGGYILWGHRGQFTAWRPGVHSYINWTVHSPSDHPPPSDPVAPLSCLHSDPITTCPPPPSTGQSERELLAAGVSSRSCWWVTTFLHWSDYTILLGMFFTTL